MQTKIITTMGRRKKKQITYDSKETFTFIGLLCLLTGLFFFISIFTQSASEANVFTKAYQLFGKSTILTAVFLISLGLHFLGTRLPFTKRGSLIGQFLLVFLMPAFLTSLSTTPRELSRLSGAEVMGGEAGYYIVSDLLGDRFPTEPGTKVILLFATLIFMPIALSMSVAELVKRIKFVLGWIGKAFTILFTDRSDTSEKEEAVLENKPSKLGDFNKLLAQKKEEKLNQQAGKPLDNPINSSPTKRIESETQVHVTEGKVGEEGLHHDKLLFPGWKLPPLSLLIPFVKATNKEESIDQNAKVIEQILSSFGIEASVEDAYIGPSVIQYAIDIPLGIKVSKVSNLTENLALALGVDSNAVRIESIPETTYLGIEVPRTNRELVRFKELMSSENMKNAKGMLPVPIGKDISGEAVIGSIEKMPHLLIAGATGSGKSILTNSFIASILMKKTPDELKLILVDPKQVELSDYNGIPHLLTPVITDMDKVVNALKWAVGEMDRRYTTLAESQVRNIEQYNEKKGFAAMPYIVIVIDEMADMMMTANRGDAETAIVRLAQKARAVGVHLILATQRPSVNVITGIIKANIPGRVGMSVTSSTDSRVILDRNGAESLMGHGDLLYKSPSGPKVLRLQSTLIEQEEVIKIVDFLKSQAPEVEYISEITERQVTDEEAMNAAMTDISDDNLVEQAIRIVVAAKKGSASYLQRRLNIGFNRAARLLDELEEAGVVGPANGPKPREVLIDDADSFIMQLRGA